jgi:hypothetical protein
MTRPLPGLLALVLAGVVLIGAGCDEKKTTETAPTGDAGASMDKYATADPKLAKALQAAAASASAGNENGPPADGVFAPGVADKRHPQGAPTKVDMVGDGDEPRISLAGGADTVRSSYGPAALELSMMTGPRMATPTVDLSVTLGAAKKEDGGPDWLVGEVKKALPAHEQAGELPAGTDKVIGSLEGTLVRVKLSADGGETDVQTQLGKQAEKEVDRIAKNAAEALVLASVPLPPKQVGVGAQWIAESRMPLASLDVIAYRAFKVKSIDGNRVRLSFDLKAYAASPTTTLGVPKGATMEQVDAQGQGELELVRGEVLARKSDVQLRVVMMFRAPGSPDQTDPSSPPEPGQPPAGARMLSAQMQSQATFVRGDDLRAALHP